MTPIAAEVVVIPHVDHGRGPVECSLSTPGEDLLVVLAVLAQLQLVRVEIVREPASTYSGEGSISLATQVLPYLEQIRFADREQFACIHLNARSAPLGIEIVSVGSLSASLVHPREIFKAAIMNNAAAVILAHNHPTGDPSPSSQDLELTKRLCQAGEILGIEVLDHVIVTPRENFLSMKEAGIL